MNPFSLEIEATLNATWLQAGVGPAPSVGAALGLGACVGVGDEPPGPNGGVLPGLGLIPGCGEVPRPTCANPLATICRVACAWHAPFQQMRRMCVPSSRSLGRKILPLTLPLPSALNG